MYQEYTDEHKKQLKKAKIKKAVSVFSTTFCMLSLIGWLMIYFTTFEPNPFHWSMVFRGLAAFWMAFILLISFISAIDVYANKYDC